MTTVLLSRDNKDITKFGLICASPRQHVHAIKQIRKARTIIWRHNKLVDHLGSRSDIQQSSTSHRDVSFCGGLLIAKGSFSRTFYRVAECTKEYGICSFHFWEYMRLPWAVPQKTQMRPARQDHKRLTFEHHFLVPSYLKAGLSQRDCPMLELLRGCVEA